MQTIRKNVKNYLLFVAYVALFSLIFIISVFLSSESPGAMTPFFIPKYKTVIVWAALLIFFCLMSYKFYRSIKCAENPRQAIWDNLKAHIVILLSISAMSYVGMVLFTTLFLANYDRCDYYNEYLDGGVKEYQGQKFKVHMCRNAGHASSDEYYEIRLQILNEKGELLALRHFAAHNGSSPKRLQIEYHPNHLVYYDDSDDDYEKTLSMPPTTLDWIRARIPLLD